MKTALSSVVRLAVEMRPPTPPDALGGAAEVEAPEVGAESAAGGVEFGHEVPAVVDEVLVAGGGLLVVDGFGDALADAAAEVVVAEFEFEFAAAFDVGAAHFDEAVLAVPTVVPATVEEQVAVGVVAELGGARGDEGIAALGVDLGAFAGIDADGFDRGACAVV